MQRTLFRHPVFGLIFVAALGSVVAYMAIALTETLVAINWWNHSRVDPTKPFPALSQIDIATRIDAVSGVLRYFFLNGSLWDSRLAQTSWRASFFIQGGALVLASTCLLLAVAGRGRLGVASLGVGALMMIGFALVAFAALVVSHGGGSRTGVLALLVVYLAVGAWGIALAWRGRHGA